MGNRRFLDEVEMTSEEIIQEGFILGYFQPNEEPGIPLSEPQMSWYREAMEAGRQARAEFGVPVRVRTNPRRSRSWSTRT
ncbi:hypothetical protein GCM10009776_36560 [Microbacterium deminutum]|uniref:Uncharacterized protein n=1 Tax=Microbacterium deminutum TaxID=344164 RepID=A0ABP5CZL4_9MICO